MKEINLIVAMTEGRVIGKNGAIPWHISEDLKLFKRLTTGNIVIMGRKTFDSIGRPLPNRKNFVISRSIKEEDKVAGVFYFKTVEEALDAAQCGGERIFIIGGASVYSQVADKADRLYVSVVEGDYDGDAYFPEIRKDVWKVAGIEPHEGFTLNIFERK